MTVMLPPSRVFLDYPREKASPDSPVGRFYGLVDELATRSERALLEQQRAWEQAQAERAREEAEEEANARRVHDFFRLLCTAPKRALAPTLQPASPPRPVRAVAVARWSRLARRFRAQTNRSLARRAGRFLACSRRWSVLSEKVETRHCSGLSATQVQKQRWRRMGRRVHHHHITAPRMAELENQIHRRSWRHSWQKWAGLLAFYRAPWRRSGKRRLAEHWNAFKKCCALDQMDWLQRFKSRLIMVDKRKIMQSAQQAYERFIEVKSRHTEQYLHARKCLEEVKRRRKDHPDNKQLVVMTANLETRMRELDDDNLAELMQMQSSANGITNSPKFQQIVAFRIWSYTLLHDHDSVTPAMIWVFWMYLESNLGVTTLADLMSQNSTLVLYRLRHLHPRMAWMADAYFWLHEALWRHLEGVRPWPPAEPSTTRDQIFARLYPEHVVYYGTEPPKALLATARHDPVRNDVEVEYEYWRAYRYLTTIAGKVSAYLDDFLQRQVYLFWDVYHARDTNEGECLYLSVMDGSFNVGHSVEEMSRPEGCVDWLRYSMLINYGIPMDRSHCQTPMNQLMSVPLSQCPAFVLDDLLEVIFVPRKNKPHGPTDTFQFLLMTTHHGILHTPSMPLEELVGWFPRPQMLMDRVMNPWARCVLRDLYGSMLASVPPMAELVSILAANPRQTNIWDLAEDRYHTIHPAILKRSFWRDRNTTILVEPSEKCTPGCCRHRCILYLDRTLYLTQGPIASKLILGTDRSVQRIKNKLMNKNDEIIQHWKDMNLIGKYK